MESTIRVFIDVAGGATDAKQQSVDANKDDTNARRPVNTVSFTVAVGANNPISIEKGV